MADTQKVPVTVETRAGVAPRAPAHSPFESLRREIDQVFDSFRAGFGSFPFARRGFDLDLPLPGFATPALMPAMDVAERENAYEITAELPGMEDKDIEVKLANGLLTIRGEKKDEHEEQEKDYYLSERRYGCFVRNFQVPEGVDIDKVEARFAKSVEAQKQEKKIEIKAA